MGGELDVFTQINNAVLDLQASHYQTYVRPMKTLARLLQHPSLEAANRRLTEGADLDAFLSESEGTGGSMIGSHRLAWPAEPEKGLGLTLLLIEKFAQEEDYAISFAHFYFHSGNTHNAGLHSLIRQLIIPFVRDYKAYIMNQGNVEPKLVKPKSNNVFIVHGHDGEARESVARFLESLGLKAIILHEQANRGRTVIEKVEANSDVGFAVVLLTPDDVGRAKGDAELEPRARQNVLLELGYFIGKLGRENVCALKRGTVEIPSDFAGVVWETMDSGTGWKQALGRELEAAGYSIDWNKVMRP
ncbi:TIR domain-containing protein [Herbaspirillum sp. GCM10030257]|uniref:TIR domain-containing protein n=1 Tax=Herbaspirillum sp. GCM10030257 TaxID=3273393 RepID=UPI00360E469C